MAIWNKSLEFRDLQKKGEKNRCVHTYWWQDFLEFATSIYPPVDRQELNSQSERALIGTIYRFHLWKTFWTVKVKHPFFFLNSTNTHSIEQKGTSEEYLITFCRDHLIFGVCVEGRLALCMRAMFVGVYSRAGLCLTFVPDRSVWAWWYFGIRSQLRRDARQRCEKGRNGDAYDWYSH